MGRKLLEQKAKIDKERLYSPREALELLKDLDGAKFDESVEVHVKLNVDPRKADQMVRGTLMLPNGTGKVRKVAVFAVGENAREAEEAGADVVGSEDLAARIRDEGFTEFDVAVATPDQMSIVGRLGPFLGPRGLMPNPKSGTVTPNVGRAVEEIKRGKVEYRVDRYGIIHGIIGKKSFDLDSLVENYFALRDELQRVRPAAVKGRYFRSVAITSTMGPSIKVDPAVEVAANGEIYQSPGCLRPRGFLVAEDLRRGESGREGAGDRGAHRETEGRLGGVRGLQGYERRSEHPLESAEPRVGCGVRRREEHPGAAGGEPGGRRGDIGVPGRTYGAGIQRRSGSEREVDG